MTELATYATQTLLAATVLYVAIGMIREALHGYR